MKTEYKTIQNVQIKSYLPDNENNINCVVLCVTGFNGGKESSTLKLLAQNLCTNNYTAVVCFDLYAHGKDKHLKLKLDGCLRYYKIVYSYVKTTYPQAKISLFATSFGCYLSLICLNKFDLKFEHIIFRAPAINMAGVLANVLLGERNLSLESLSKFCNVGNFRKTFINATFYNDLKTNNLDNMNFDSLKTKIVVFQGLKDTAVDPDYNKSFFERKIKNFEWIPLINADHAFSNVSDLNEVILKTKQILE